MQSSRVKLQAWALTALPIGARAPMRSAVSARLAPRPDSTGIAKRRRCRISGRRGRTSGSGSDSAVLALQLRDRWKGRGSAQRSSALGAFDARQAGVWYLVAAIEGGHAVPHFRVSNIKSAERDRPLRRSAALPAVSYLQRQYCRIASVKRFERELFSGHAAVLATPAGLRGLRHLGHVVAKALASVAPAAASRRSREAAAADRIGRACHRAAASPVTRGRGARACAASRCHHRSAAAKCRRVRVAAH